MKLLNEKIDDLLAYEGESLTDWEIEFVDSIDKQRRNGRGLSDKQIDIVEKLYEKI